MTDSYFEHNARKQGRKEVALDVIEFTPEPCGIEVEERDFDSTGEFRRFWQEQIGANR